MSQFQYANQVQSPKPTTPLTSQLQRNMLDAAHRYANEYFSRGKALCALTTEEDLVAAMEVNYRDGITVPAYFEAAGVVVVAVNLPGSYLVGHLMRNFGCERELCSLVMDWFCYSGHFATSKLLSMGSSQLVWLSPSSLESGDVHQMVRGSLSVPSNVITKDSSERTQLYESISRRFGVRLRETCKRFTSVDWTASSTFRARLKVLITSKQILTSAMLSDYLVAFGFSFGPILRASFLNAVNMTCCKIELSRSEQPSIFKTNNSDKLLIADSTSLATQTLRQLLSSQPDLFLRSPYLLQSAQSSCTKELLQPSGSGTVKRDLTSASAVKAAASKRRPSVAEEIFSSHPESSVLSDSDTEVESEYDDEDAQCIDTSFVNATLKALLQFPLQQWPLPISHIALLAAGAMCNTTSNRLGDEERRIFLRRYLINSPRVPTTVRSTILCPRVARLVTGASAAINQYNPAHLLLTLRNGLSLTASHGALAGLQLVTAVQAERESVGNYTKDWMADRKNIGGLLKNSLNSCSLARGLTSPFAPSPQMDCALKQTPSTIANLLYLGISLVGKESNGYHPGPLKFVFISSLAMCRRVGPSTPPPNSLTLTYIKTLSNGFSSLCDRLLGLAIGSIFGDTASDFFQQSSVSTFAITDTLLWLPTTTAGLATKALFADWASAMTQPGINQPQGQHCWWKLFSDADERSCPLSQCQKLVTEAMNSTKPSIGAKRQRAATPKSFTRSEVASINDGFMKVLGVIQNRLAECFDSLCAWLAEQTPKDMNMVDYFKQSLADWQNVYSFGISTLLDPTMLSMPEAAALIENVLASTTAGGNCAATPSLEMQKILRFFRATEAAIAEGWQWTRAETEQLRLMFVTDEQNVSASNKLQMPSASAVLRNNARESDDVDDWLEMPIDRLVVSIATSKLPLAIPCEQIVSGVSAKYSVLDCAKETSFRKSAEEDIAAIELHLDTFEAAYQKHRATEAQPDGCSYFGAPCVGEEIVEIYKAFSKEMKALGRKVAKDTKEYLMALTTGGLTPSLQYLQRLLAFHQEQQATLKTVRGQEISSIAANRKSKRRIEGGPTARLMGMYSAKLILIAYDTARMYRRQVCELSSVLLEVLEATNVLQCR